MSARRRHRQLLSIEGAGTFTVAGSHQASSGNSSPPHHGLLATAVPRPDLVSVGLTVKYSALPAPEPWARTRRRRLQPDLPERQRAGRSPHRAGELRLGPPSPTAGDSTQTFGLLGRLSWNAAGDDADRCRYRSRPAQAPGRATSDPFPGRPSTLSTTQAIAAATVILLGEPDDPHGGRHPTNASTPMAGPDLHPLPDIDSIRPTFVGSPTRLGMQLAGNVPLPTSITSSRRTDQSPKAQLTPWISPADASA
jgi:hypothetical protein